MLSCFRISGGATRDEALLEAKDLLHRLIQGGSIGIGPIQNFWYGARIDLFAGEGCKRFDLHLLLFAEFSGNLLLHRLSLHAQWPSWRRRCAPPQRWFRVSVRVKPMLQLWRHCRKR